MSCTIHQIEINPVNSFTQPLNNEACMVVFFPFLVDDAWNCARKKRKKKKKDSNFKEVSF